MNDLRKNLKALEQLQKQGELIKVTHKILLILKELQEDLLGLNKKHRTRVKNNIYQMQDSYLDQLFNLDNDLTNTDKIKLLSEPKLNEFVLMHIEFYKLELDKLRATNTGTQEKTIQE